MIRRSAHDGQTCGIVYATLQSNCFERSQSLIVIHRQHTVEVVVGARTEEAVGSKRTKGLNTLVCQFLNGGQNDVLLLRTQQSVVASMWIQREHGNARTGNAEVALQCFVENGCLLDNAFFGNRFGYVLDGQMRGNKSYTQRLVHQNH